MLYNILFFDINPFQMFKKKDFLNSILKFTFSFNFSSPIYSSCISLYLTLTFLILFKIHCVYDRKWLKGDHLIWCKKKNHRGFFCISGIYFDHLLFMHSISIYHINLGQICLSNYFIIWRKYNYSNSNELWTKHIYSS